VTSRRVPALVARANVRKRAACSLARRLLWAGSEVSTMNNIARALLCGIPVFVGSSAARADGDPDVTLHQRGTIFISGELSAAAVRYTTDEQTLNVVSLRPSLDFFVGGGLTIGGAALVGYAGYGEGWGSDWSLGVAPRVGYAVAIHERVTIWPRASFAYDFSIPQGESLLRAEDKYSVSLEVPALVAVAPHLAVGIGPVLSYTPAQDGFSARRAVGLSSVVGGWF
jgi:hypothetical protein